MPRRHESSRRSPSAHAVAITVACEAVEPRRLLSADYFGTGGADTIRVGMSGSTMTVTVNGFVNNVPAGTDIVNVFADAGNDSLLIDATSLPMLLNGGGGEDVFRFGDAFHDMDPIDGATSIAGDSGVDRVVLDDRADNASHQWSFNTTQLARSGWGGAVYAGVETLEAFGGQAGAGDETYDVNAVAITATLTVATGDGSDTVRLAPAGNTLDAIEGALAVDGEGGSDSLVLFDRANAFDDAFTIDSEHIGRGFFGGVNYANFEVATLNAGGAPGVAAAPGSTARPADADADADGPGAGPGAGPEGNNADNVFQILSTSALTVVNGGSGNDSYLVGNGDLSQMLGDVVVDGESGTDSVLVDDNNGEIFSDAYGVTADNVSFNNNPLVSYARVEALTLEAPEGNNTIRLHSTTPTTPVTILGGGGNDVFHLTDGDLSPIDAPLVIHGGDELDTLNVNDQAATRAENYTMTATSVTAQSMSSPLTYQALENLVLDATGGANVVTVLGTSATTNVAVNGHGGTDTIDVRESAGLLPVAVHAGGGDDTVNVNADGLGAASVVFNAPDSLASLNIGQGGRAMIEADGANTLRMGTLGLSGNGTIDVTDNALVVDYTGTSPLPVLRLFVNNAYTGGAWTGTGITSSTAAGQAERGVGYAEASSVFTAFPATFVGQSVDNTAVLVRYTILGDANLDQTVNLADFNRLAGGFGTSNLWQRGNFNYDDSVGLADFNRLATNFGRSVEDPVV